MNTTTVPLELTVLARIRSGSNAVFRCVDAAGEHWVYKPVAGEQPLRDFPDGTLAHRERASYLVSEALGWELVPETVLAHGPGGAGMAQRWVEEAPTSPALIDAYPSDAVPEGYLGVLRGEDDEGKDVVVAHSPGAELRRTAVFDEIINNADRKGGHILVDATGRVRAIDHGLSFHVHPKIRTVLWGWAGVHLHADDTPGVTALSEALGVRGTTTTMVRRLSELLDIAEIDALRCRVAQLLESGVHPLPGDGYPLPWPLF